MFDIISIGVPFVAGKFFTNGKSFMHRVHQQQFMLILSKAISTLPGLAGATEQATVNKAKDITTNLLSGSISIASTFKEAPP